MIFLQLFLTFFQIGIFGFGGGYGMISLIQGEVVQNHAWMNNAEFTEVLAISQMTPGPIGINTATYCGYTAVLNAGYGSPWGILGSIMSTFALVLPSFMLMIAISCILMKYMNSKPVQDVFALLRPVVVGLLAAAVLLLMSAENFGTLDNPWQFWISVALFIASFIGVKVFKVNAIHMILMSAFAGLLLL